MLTSMKETIERIHSFQHETIYLALLISVYRMDTEYRLWFQSAAAIANRPSFNGRTFLSATTAMREFYMSNQSLSAEAAKTGRF
jgi:hypothetical protein